MEAWRSKTRVQLKSQVTLTCTPNISHIGPLLKKNPYFPNYMNSQW